MLQLLRVALPVPVERSLPDPRCATSSRHRDEAAWLERTTRPSPTTPNRASGSSKTLTSVRTSRGSTLRASCCLEIDGRIAASCWTKVHELHPDRFGEIYVVSVHPGLSGPQPRPRHGDPGSRRAVAQGRRRRRLFVDESNDRRGSSTTHWAFGSNAKTDSCAFTALVLADEAADAERHRGGERPDHELTQRRSRGNAAAREPTDGAADEECGGTPASTIDHHTRVAGRRHDPRQQAG